MTDDRVLNSQVRSQLNIHLFPWTHILQFCQRPVWKEQWCARKDAVESSGGKEDQFWATGFSETLPPPSLPQASHHYSRSLHPADPESPRPTYSNAPSPMVQPSMSATRKGRAGVARRRHLSNSTHLRGQPTSSVRFPRMHGHVSDRDFVNTIHSTEPYPLNFKVTGDRRTHHRSRRDETSPFSGEWNQFRARSGSSANPGYDIEQQFEDSLQFSSRSAPQMLPVGHSYPMQSRMPGADPSTSALFTSSISSQAINSSLTPSHLDYTELKSHTHPQAQSAQHVQDMGSFFGPGDVSYDGIWPYSSPASQAVEESFSWPGDQQMGHFLPDAQSTVPFHASPAHSHMAHLHAQDHELSYNQFAQPSSQQFITPVSNEQSPPFALNSEFYNAPNDFYVARRFTDFNVQPTMHRSNEGILESFPNIVEDEDGMFHIKE